MDTLFFRQPRLVALTMLVLIAAGMSAFLSIGRQEDPTITNLFATITTVYPGAEPARIEALVTDKIENELREIASIDVLESTSATGISIVSVELLETLDSADIEIAWSDVRDALDDAKPLLPAGVLPIEFDTTGAGTFSAITALVPTDGTSIAVTQRYAQSIADRLRRITGTDSVVLFGEQAEEIVVEIDPGVLTSLGLTVDQVSNAIRTADAKVQAGRARTSDANYVIEVAGEIDALERIWAIPLASSNGAITRLGDISQIKKTVRQPEQEMAVVSGKPAVIIAAKISDGLQVDVWMKDVQAELAKSEASLPRSITLEKIFDQSRYTRDRLNNVAGNMALGVALVIGVLLLTLGVRAALIVAMVLPLVTLASIATMNAFGLAIHQMSLTGLIVALGLLVDAAIVMTDEIRQRLKEGMSRLLAVRSSVRRLFGPLLASTITTALSFMPMVLLPGPAGDFVGAIAIAVIIMLCWSFFIAVTVTAAIAGWILPSVQIRVSRFGNGIPGGWVADKFRATLNWSMRYPASSVMLALVLPLMGFASAGTLTAQFFPGVDRDQFHIEVEMASGSAIAATRESAMLIDQVLREADGIKQVSWVIGKSAPAFYYNMVGNKDRAPQFAQALITTESPDATARLVPALQAQLNREFPEARILVKGLVQGPPVNAPVEIRLVGQNLDTLKTTGNELRAIISEVDAVTTVRSSFDGGAPKVVFDVDENKASLAGLRLTDVSRQLEATLEGSVGGSMLEGTEELPVRVRAGNVTRGDLNAIANLPLVSSTSAGTRSNWSGIPLSAVAELSLVPSQSPISRRNGERVNTVQAFIQYGVLPEEALKRVQAAMQDAGFTPPPGYRVQTGGDSDARDNTLNNLLASLGIIVTLSIASVVVTFNSFRLATVTLVVAGLSAGLSMLALAIFQYPFGINAIIGVIGSIGVSINAAIIILTGMQKNSAACAGDTTAMVDVIMNSSRHIVSTTITTFGGFLPLILEGGGFWPPFAMSVAGGVLLSTVVSFYFTPAMFRLVYARRINKEALEPGGVAILVT